MPANQKLSYGFPKDGPFHLAGKANIFFLHLILRLFGWQLNFFNVSIIYGTIFGETLTRQFYLVPFINLVICVVYFLYEFSFPQYIIT